MLTAALTTQAVAQTRDSLSLSLEEALQLAETQSLSLRSADLALGKSRIDKRVGRAKLFPSVNFAGQYGYTLKKQLVYFGSEDASGSNPMAAMMPTDGIEMGQKHNITGTLSASVPLVAPQLWASLELDEFAIESALEKVRSSRIALRSEVRKAYMGILLAQESLRVLQVSEEQLKRSEEDIRQKYQRGLVAEYELIRMGVQLKNLKPNITQAEQQLRLAKMKLLVLMNQDPAQGLSLKSSLGDYEPQVEALVERYAQRADLSQNVHLRQLDLGLRQLDLGLKVKRMEYYPTLALSFNYTYNFASDHFRLDNSRRWSPTSSIGLSLSVPIFTGGSTKYGIKSMQLQQEQARVQRAELEQQLRLQEVGGQDALRHATEQYRASREAVQSAERGLSIAEVRYKSGAGTLLELNDTELALRQAQLNIAQSVYNYMLAIYALDELRGN